MTHDKLQDAAQRVQENVQYAKDAVGEVQQKVDTAKQTYEVMVESGAQNVNGGEDMIMQLADTVIASGILEKIGAEYGATGAAVVAVVVGLYWTWRKKSQEQTQEIAKMPEEETAEPKPAEEAVAEQPSEEKSGDHKATS